MSDPDNAKAVHMEALKEIDRANERADKAERERDEARDESEALEIERDTVNGECNMLARERDSLIEAAKAAIPSEEHPTKETPANWAWQIRILGEDRRAVYRVKKKLNDLLSRMDAHKGGPLSQCETHKLYQERDEARTQVKAQARDLERWSRDALIESDLICDDGTVVSNPWAQVATLRGILIERFGWSDDELDEALAATTPETES
jgi:uncharacterized protein (DUF3084 family)